MDFPGWHFPAPPIMSDYGKSHKLDKTREVFGDYGEHRRMNWNGQEWIAQKSHKAPARRLAASLPSLPLLAPVKCELIYFIYHPGLKGIVNQVWFNC